MENDEEKKEQRRRRRGITQHHICQVPALTLVHSNRSRLPNNAVPTRHLLASKKTKWASLFLLSPRSKLPRRAPSHGSGFVSTLRTSISLRSPPTLGCLLYLPLLLSFAYPLFPPCSPYYHGSPNQVRNALECAPSYAACRPHADPYLLI